METITTRMAPAAIGPYSQAVRDGATLYCSGQIPLDPETGEVVGDDVAKQTDRVMANLSAVLEAGGSSLDRVMSTTVYLADMADFQAFNERYAAAFGDHAPARATVAVAGLPKGVQVEVACIAKTVDA